MSDELTFVCKHCGSARIATIEQCRPPELRTLGGT